MQRFYAKYIAENYQNRFNKTTTISLGKNFVFVDDSSSENKIPVSEFEKLIEISDCFFLKLKTANAFIIPKKQIDAAQLKSGIATLNISITEETNWKWQ